MAAGSAVSAGVLVGIAVLLVALYVAPLAWGSRRPPLPPLDEAALVGLAPLPGITVVVAARDEAAVIGHLIADLGVQTHRDPDGTPRFELLVVDDRSVDGTAAVARRAAGAAGLGGMTRVIRREAIPPRPPDGKGAALASVPPSVYRYEIVAVLDADARIDPEFLTRMAGYFARGVRAMTARRRVFPMGAARGLARFLHGAQVDEQTADGEIQRGRWSLGGCSEFRGNGMVLSRDLLLACGGWPAGALCEDLDLATRVAALGVEVGWAIDAPVWEEPVLEFRRLWRQRLRWGEGIVRRNLALTGALLRSRSVGWRRRFDFLSYGLQTLIPTLWLGSVAGAVAGGRWLVPTALGLVYQGAGSVLAFDALRWEQQSGRGSWARLARAVRVTLFSALWIPVLSVAWTRVALGDGAVHFAKTAHAGAPDGWHPRRGEPEVGRPHPASGAAPSGADRFASGIDEAFLTGS